MLVRADRKEQSGREKTGLFQSNFELRDFLASAIITL